MTSEGRIQDDVRLALNHPAMVTWRNNVGTAEIGGRRIRYGIGNPGGSDLVAVFRGHAAFIEIKTPVGRLSDAQRVFARLVESKGAIYTVVRSAADATALLAELERRFPE